ncbi:MAG TPA: alpha/beta hydrolase [Mycobacterium sp.]
MALPALVLVHGGAHAADCWDLTVDELHRQAPELSVLAVDLPGRAGKPGELAALSIGDCVESVVADIEDAGLRDVVICGHSMAGVIVPGVVTKLGSSRVREMILAAAFVPPQDTSVLDTLGGPLGWYARRAGAARQVPVEMPRFAARLAFCNGMTRRQRRFLLPRICGESVRLVTEKVDRDQLPDDVKRTWILTLRDHSLSVRTQRKSIDVIGGVQTLIPVDTCHCLMVSEPERLSEILVERCRLWSDGPS